jgi:hypothetical protein
MYINQHLLSVLKKYLQSDSDNPFADIDNFGRNTNPNIDELEEYLNSPTISGPSTNDPLQYWASFSRSPLARMATDYLSAPGKCSTLLYQC